MLRHITVIQEQLRPRNKGKSQAGDRRLNAKHAWRLFSKPLTIDFFGLYIGRHEQERSDCGYDDGQEIVEERSMLCRRHITRDKGRR